MFADDWIINLALFALILFIAYSLYKVFIKGKKTKTGKNILELEKIYFDTKFLLNFPYLHGSTAHTGLIYTDDDKKMEKAVNDYFKGELNTDIPEEKVFETAMNFMKSKSVELQNSDDIAKSPVTYYDNDKVKEKITGILEYLNNNIYSFSKTIENLIMETNSTDPAELFEKNRKLIKEQEDPDTENPDPYLELFLQIKKEYEELLLKGNT